MPLPHPIARVPAVLSAGLIVLLCLWATPSAGQIRLGLRVMPQLNSVQNSADADQPDLQRLSTSGYSLGASVGYQFSPRWGVEINALYASQGQDYERRMPNVAGGSLADTVGLAGLGVGGFYTERLSLTVLKIPVMLTWSSVNNPKAIFRAFFGPQVSLITGNTINRNFPNNPRLPAGSDGVRSGDAPDVDYGPYEDPEFPFERYKGIEYSLVGGAGYDFRITPVLYLNTSVRIEYGLTDIENKDAVWLPTAFAPTPGGPQNVRYYDHYYGNNRPRTSSTTQLVIGFSLGITYHLNTNKDAGRYNW